MVPEVGDLIQWQCGDYFMFKPLAKVTDISPCGRFVFVEGSRCGIPVSEIVEIQKPDVQQQLARRLRRKPRKGS